MKIKIYQADAFTTEPFGGNPAGVVPDATGITEEYMQKIAREMNLSETAFIIPIDNDNFKVRFFTPVSEVDLCGHATIASFYTLANKGYISPIDNGVKTVYQETNAGKLKVDIYYKDGTVDKVMMQQAIPEDLGEVKDINPLLDCINIDINDIGIEGNKVTPKIISTGLPDLLLPINSKNKLDNLKVDLNKLKEFSRNMNITGVHAFHLPRLDSEIVYTRNFAPLVGIDEESATGTSNGALIFFLKDGGYVKGNEIISLQGESLNRPSRIHCIIDEEDGKYNVRVGGEARIVIEGILSF